MDGMKLSRRTLFSSLTLVLLPVLLASSSMVAQEQMKHGRKYKPPPETSKITVTVTKKFNGKPIMNAAVIFNPYDKDGNDIGNLEVKTDPDGKATIDIIPTGSTVRVQVIASGFATYAQDFQVEEASRDIDVAMLRPREQISSYSENDGKESSRKSGVQEPVRPKSTDKPTTPPPANSTAPQQ